MFPCDKCSKAYTNKTHLVRHVRSAHEGTTFSCIQCSAIFKRRDYLNEHMKKCGGEPTKKRPHTRQEELSQAEKRQRFEPADVANITLSHVPSDNSGSRSQTSALNDSARDVDLHIVDCFEPLDMCLNSLRSEIREVIEEQVILKNGIKWSLIVKVRFVRVSTWTKDDVREIETYFRSITRIALHETHVDDHISRGIAKVLEKMQKFIREGSGWRYDSLLLVRISMATYAPLAASSYFSLHKELADTKAIVNIQNKENKCFLWSVLNVDDSFSICEFFV